MTDTTELLKYAEGLTWRPISEASDEVTRILATNDENDVQVIDWGKDWCSHGCYIPTHFMPIPDGQAGEVIKVLVEGLQEIAAIADCHQAGVFFDPAHKALTRATAILGNNLKDKTDEAHNG